MSSLISCYYDINSIKVNHSEYIIPYEEGSVRTPNNQLFDARTRKARRYLRDVWLGVVFAPVFEATALEKVRRNLVFGVALITDRCCAYIVEDHIAKECAKHDKKKIVNSFTGNFLEVKCIDKSGFVYVYNAQYAKKINNRKYLVYITKLNEYAFVKPVHWYIHNHTYNIITSFTRDIT